MQSIESMTAKPIERKSAIQQDEPRYTNTVLLNCPTEKDRLEALAEKIYVQLFGKGYFPECLAECAYLSHKAARAFVDYSPEDSSDEQ